MKKQLISSKFECLFIPGLILLKSPYVSSRLRSLRQLVSDIHLCGPSAQSLSIFLNDYFFGINQDAILLSMGLLTKIKNVFKLT